MNITVLCALNHVAVVGAYLVLGLCDFTLTPHFVGPPFREEVNNNNGGSLFSIEYSFELFCSRPRDNSKHSSFSLLNVTTKQTDARERDLDLINCTPLKRRRFSIHAQPEWNLLLPFAY